MAIQKCDASCTKRLVVYVPTILILERTTNANLARVKIKDLLWTMSSIKLSVPLAPYGTKRRSMTQTTYLQSMLILFPKLLDKVIVFWVTDQCRIKNDSMILSYGRWTGTYLHLTDIPSDGWTASHSNPSDRPQRSDGSPFTYYWTSHPEGGANATTEGSAQRGSNWFFYLADSSLALWVTFQCRIKNNSMFNGGHREGWISRGDLLVSILNL